MLQKAAKTGHEVWAVKKMYGGWQTSSYAPYEVINEHAGAEYYHVSAGLFAATHHTDGKDAEVPAAKVSALAQQMVDPIR